MKTSLLMVALYATATLGARLLKVDGPIIEDEYIVVLKKGLKPAVVAQQTFAITKAVAAHNQTSEIYSFYNIGTFNGYSGRFDDQILESILANPLVDYVEQNGIATIVGNQLNPPSWGLDRTDQVALPLDKNFRYPDTQGAGVDAYVIDTGIYISHNDYVGRAVWGSNYVGDGRNDDCNGHGTHVAGTVGGTVYGIAKKANLIAVKVLGCSGSGAWSGVISGLNWVTQQHQASDNKQSVGNMSLGGGKTQSVNDATSASIAAGVVHVVAAGNNGGDACLYSPASTPEAISVGATESTDRIAAFSNRGSCMDIWAPGSSILSTYIGSPTATATLSGTSMAAPHVAGVVALHLAEDGSTAPATVLKRLTDNASEDVLANVPAGSPDLLLFSEYTGK